MGVIPLAVLDQIVRQQEEITRLTAENERYKEVLEILVSILHYGNWQVETYNERELHKMLVEFGLWPTSEDEIMARTAKRKALEEI